MLLDKPPFQWELYPTFFLELCRSAPRFATGFLPPSTSSITNRIS